MEYGSKNVNKYFIYNSRFDTSLKEQEGVEEGVVFLFDASALAKMATCTIKLLQVIDENLNDSMNRDTCNDARRLLKIRDMNETK